MQWRFILQCKSLVERLCTVSLAKNVSKAIAFLKYLWCQCTHELGKQFRTYTFHISAIESVYDPGDELSFFLAQFLNVYHLASSGYNCFAQENGIEAIDIDAVERCPGHRVGQHLDEWVMLCQSKVLAARGEIFEARDKVLSLLKTDDPGTDL